MSIIAATTSSAEGMIVLVGLAISVTVFALCRVHQPSRVRGPIRVDPAQPLELLAGIAFAGFAGWLLASLAALTLLRGPASPPTTAPSAIPPLLLIWSSLIGQVSGLLIVGLATLVFRPGGLSRLGLSPGKLRRGLVAAAAGVLFVLPAMVCVGIGTERLWRLIGFEHPTKHELLTAMDNSGTLRLRIMAILSAVVVAPLFEELLFRGHFQTLLRRVFTERRQPDGRIDIHDTPSRLWLTIILSAVAFTVVHPVWTYPPIFFLALCLGYIYERTGNLWAPIVVHAVFNAIQTGLSLAMG